MRKTDSEVHPAAQSRRSWAQRRVIGSWALGAVSLWKLMTVETDPYLWVITAGAAFGIAQWHELITAIKR